MQLLSSLFLIIYSLAVVGTIVVIVTDNRNPLKTVISQLQRTKPSLLR